MTFGNSLSVVLVVLSTVFGAGVAHAQAPDTPLNFEATRGSRSDGILLSWTPVAGATGYEIRSYADLFTSTRISTLSIGAVNGAHLIPQPCGVYYYLEILAKNASGTSAPSPRTLGYTASCGGGTQSCLYDAIPLTGTGSVTFSTIGSQNSYRIGDKTGPCGDGNDPGTAGTGNDMVFTYVSGVDCTLSLTLEPEGGFEPILYVSQSCEAYSCDYFSNMINNPENLTFSVTKDTPYYIFVDGYNDFPVQGAGAFTLTMDTVDCAAPETCADASFGFDNGALPAGWSTADRDGSGAQASGRYGFDGWGVIEDLSGSAYNNVVAAYAPVNGLGTTDDWLIAGPFTVDQDSSVTWRDARVGGGGVLELGLYVASTPDPDAFLFEGKVFSVVTVDLAATMTTRTVPLNEVAAANGQVYIGFRHVGSQSGFLLLDDIGLCGAAQSAHTSDQNGNGVISLSELLRVIQFYNSLRLHCEAGTEDGYSPGIGDESCAAHASDYAPTDWVISLSELLRLIQFYNSGGYTACDDGEDGFCPGTA